MGKAQALHSLVQCVQAASCPWPCLSTAPSPAAGWQPGAPGRWWARPLRGTEASMNAADSVCFHYQGSHALSPHQPPPAVSIGTRAQTPCVAEYTGAVPGRVFLCACDSPRALTAGARPPLGSQNPVPQRIQRNSDFQRKSVGVLQRC